MILAVYVNEVKFQKIIDARQQKQDQHISAEEHLLFLFDGWTRRRFAAAGLFQRLLDVALLL